MPTKVIMPKQGLQMTEGTITKWIIEEGQKVEKDAPLFEMETDKLNIEIVSPAEGILLKIIRGVGEVVPITEIIAIIGNEGEDLDFGFDGDEDLDIDKDNNKDKDVDADAEKSSIVNDEKTSNKRIFATPRAKMVASEKGIEVTNVAGTGPDGLVIEKDILNFKVIAAATPKVTPATHKVTPLAAKVAQQKDLNLAEVEGTGSRGKITKMDVESAIAQNINMRDTKVAVDEKKEVIDKRKASVGERKGHVVPFAGMRKVISERMMQSIHGMAQANHRMKVDMSEIIRFREKLKEAGIKVSFTDIIIKVVSKALLDFPILNSTLTEEGILLKDYVNMGLAVAVENGLIVPVIKDADLLTLEELSIIAGELAHKAKKGCLKPDEYSGGTFTITNLGMFDIDEFTAVINPPESAILAIGKIDKVPVVEGESIVIKPIMMLSLTYDHRIIDGAPAAQFLQRVKQIMQNPYLLV